MIKNPTMPMVNFTISSTKARDLLFVPGWTYLLDIRGIMELLSARSMRYNAEMGVNVEELWERAAE